MTADYILECRDLSKAFSGFIAVDNVNLAVKRGTIHALIGPNGAGKTTVFNLVTKFIAPTNGTILFNGVDITHERPAETARRGLVRSFQISATFPHLTVLENVRVGLQRKANVAIHFWRSARTLDALNARALELLEQVDLAGFADATAAELPYGRKRALEIATTLATEPELMLLDEPSMGLAPVLVEQVFEVIRRLASEGVTILLVEQNAYAALATADRGYVIETGQIALTGTGRELLADPKVRAAYLGL